LRLPEKGSAHFGKRRWINDRFKRIQGSGCFFALGGVTRVTLQPVLPAAARFLSRAFLLREPLLAGAGAK